MILADTMDLYKEVGYASAYTFIYSKRNGTPAARMKEQIPLDVKKGETVKTDCLAVRMHRRVPEEIYRRSLYGAG